MKGQSGQSESKRNSTIAEESNTHQMFKKMKKNGAFIEIANHFNKCYY